MENSGKRPGSAPGWGNGQQWPAKFIPLVLCAVFMGFQPALSQDNGFTASAPSAVAAGEQFQYVIEGSERGEVMLPELTDFQLLAGPFSSYSSTSQWINGKMTMKTVVTYSYVLRALREGSFTIPPATVRAGGKEFRTNEVAVGVSPGGTPGTAPPGGQGSAGRTPGQQGGSSAAPGGSGTGREPSVDESVREDQTVFLRVIPSSREVYVGEQFVSGLKVFTKVNTRPAGSSSDLPYEGFYKKSVDPDASAQRQEVNGQQYVTQVIQRHILIPQKPGEITIAPYESDWMVPQRVQRRSPGSIFDDFFNDPFFDSYQDVPVTLSTLPLTIHVKPLPDGPPEGFGGAVGQFSMNSELSSTEVNENEALSLRITISGTGNLPLLAEPEVSLPPDHDLYETTRSLQTSTSGNRIRGSVVFEYPIVARHAGRYRIPPVKFAWFDPDAEAYRTATTDEFNFTVLKGEADGSAGPVYVPGVMQENVENIGTDIRDISRNPQQFTPLAYTLMGQRVYRWAYLLVILLALTAFLTIRIAARKNADLTLVRNRRASRMARSRLKQADRYRKVGEHDKFYEEIGKAIWGYLSDKLNMETSALSREAVSEMLRKRGISEPVNDELIRILDESEFSRFAPTEERSEVDRLFRDASDLIRNLESNLK